MSYLRKSLWNKNKTEEKLWEAPPYKKGDPMKNTEKEQPDDSEAPEDKGENWRREESTVTCHREWKRVTRDIRMVYQICKDH